MLKKIIVILLIMPLLFLIAPLLNAEVFGYGSTEDLSATENASNVNSSEYWVTSLGSLDDANETQFNNIGGILTIDLTWLDTLIGAISNSWWSITGSKYLVNNSGVLDLNEVALNNSIDYRVGNLTGGGFDGNVTSICLSAFEVLLQNGSCMNYTDITPDTDTFYLDTNASTVCNDAEVLLGNTSCMNISQFGGDGNGTFITVLSNLTDDINATFNPNSTQSTYNPTTNIFSIKQSFLYTLFYLESEIDSSLSGLIDATNVAWTNQTNNFTDEQIFNGINNTGKICDDETGICYTLAEMNTTMDDTSYNSTYDTWAYNQTLGLNATTHVNEGGTIRIIKSYWDGLYCLLTGCKMTGVLNMTNNDIVGINCLNGTGGGAIC